MKNQNTKTQQPNFVRTISLLVCLLASALTFAQTEEQLQKLEHFKGLYEIKDNEVVFSKVIEGIEGTKNEIFSSVISFVATAYNSANDVIQQQDKEAGIVLVKGSFELYSNAFAGVTWTCPHIFKVNIKDGRVRVMVSASEFMIHNTKAADSSVAIVPQITSDKKTNKKLYTERFIELCEWAETEINGLEAALKSMENNEDW